jgi:hypothetical protein
MNDLPEDIFKNIICYLKSLDIYALSRTSTQIKTILCRLTTDAHLFVKGSIWKYAIEYGNNKYIRWAYSEEVKTYGFLRPLLTCTPLIRRSNLKMLKWAHKRGCGVSGDECEWNVTVCILAAKYGELDILKWLLSIGIPYDKEVMKTAITNHKYDVIKYLVTTGRRINKILISTMIMEITPAIMADEADMIKWCRSKGYIY